MKKIKVLKSWVESYDEVKAAEEDLQVLYEFAKEGEAESEDVDEQYALGKKLLEELELKNMLRKEEDQMGAILKINSERWNRKS